MEDPLPHWRLKQIARKPKRFYFEDLKVLAIVWDLGPEREPPALTKPRKVNCMRGAGTDSGRSPFQPGPG